MCSLSKSFQAKLIERSKLWLCWVGATEGGACETRGVWRRGLGGAGEVGGATVLLGWSAQLQWEEVAVFQRVIGVASTHSSLLLVPGTVWSEKA